MSTSGRFETGVNGSISRVGFVASALIHLMVLVALSQWRAASPPVVPSVEAEPPPEPIARIRFPPPEALRAPEPSARRPPEPAPPRAEAKDRVSIGGPSPIRQTTPLVLRRGEDLTRNVARGRPDAPDTPVSPKPAPSPAPAPVRRATAPQPEPIVSSGPADAPLAPSAPPRSATSLPPGPSITGSLRNLEERLAEEGARGIASGTGQQMGPLFFDPRGADFTDWTNHFKNEVYRNWIVPPSVTMGIRGHVELEFLVERDGRMSGLRIVRSSGTPALDRAARNALLGSRLLPLPADFGPPQVAMQVTFFYNEPGTPS